MNFLSEYAHIGKHIVILTVSRLSQYANGGLPYKSRCKILLNSYNKIKFNIDAPSTVFKQALLRRLISDYSIKSYKILATIFETSKDVSLIVNGKPKLIQLSSFVYFLQLPQQRLQTALNLKQTLIICFYTPQCASSQGNK